MVNIAKIPSDFYKCKLMYGGRIMVETTSIMQKISQLRKWIECYNKQKDYWEVRETYETKSGNVGYILFREITEKEELEIRKGLSKIMNGTLAIVDHVRGSVHPKEKRC